MTIFLILGVRDWGEGEGEGLGGGKGRVLERERIEYRYTMYLLPRYCHLFFFLLFLNSP